MIDREELLEKYTRTEKDFTGKKFSGDYRDKIFRGGIYREADFRGAYFDGSAFRDADLSFAIFEGVRIYECVFAKNCYMEEADFKSAYFGQVTFRNVDLTRAIFRNAIFNEAGFKNADLSYVDLSGAKKLTVGDFKNVIFHKTIMPNGAVRTGRT